MTVRTTMGTGRSPTGGRIRWGGEYVEVDRPSHLAMTLTDQPDAYAGLPVLFDLEETADGTRLTTSQDRADFSDEQVEATIEGYHSFIDEIGALLAGGPTP